MSKETALGSDCPGCDQRITFVEQHIPHCLNYPQHIASAVKQARKLEIAPRMSALTHTVGEGRARS